MNFNFGYSEQDKPVPILNAVLRSDGKKIESSASQMLVFIRIFPFLVRGKIPENEDHWLCFIL